MSLDACWTVYILECSDGTLYTGVTTNIEERVRVHNAGKGAKYTRARLPVKVVWISELMSKKAAFKLEAAIKKVPRKTKLDLISGWKAFVGY